MEARDLDLSVDLSEVFCRGAELEESKALVLFGEEI